MDHMDKLPFCKHIMGVSIGLICKMTVLRILYQRENLAKDVLGILQIIYHIKNIQITFGVCSLVTSIMRFIVDLKMHIYC